MEDIKIEIEKTLYAEVHKGGVSILEGNTEKFHRVVKGGSGTGKTTLVKSLLYEPLHALGVLPGPFVKCGPGDLNHKLDKWLQKAEGGMLHIDEAYGLLNMTQTCNSLLERMDTGKTVVVLSGYEKEMNDLFDTNEGLGSRFDEIIIPPPTADKLVEIGLAHIKELGFTLTPDAEEKLREAAEYLARTGVCAASGAPKNANAIKAIVGGDVGGAIEGWRADQGNFQLHAFDEYKRNKPKKLVAKDIEDAFARFKQKYANWTEARRPRLSHTHLHAKGAQFPLRVQEFIEAVEAELRKLYARSDTPQPVLRKDVFNQLKTTEAWNMWKGDASALTKQNHDPNEPFIQAFDEACRRAFGQDFQGFLKKGTHSVQNKQLVAIPAQQSAQQ